MSYLRTLFVFAYVQCCPTHIALCCVFVLFYFVLYILCCQFLWIAPSVFSNVYLSVSLDCHFLNASSVFSNVYLFCVLCTLCCQFLWIVIF
jgi:hypothetical protein